MGRKHVGTIKYTSAGEPFIEAILHGKEEIPVDFSIGSCMILSQIDRVTAIRLGIKGHPKLVVSPLRGNTERLDYLSKVDISILNYRTSIMIRVNESLQPQLGADLTAIYNMHFKIPESQFTVSDPADVMHHRIVYASQMFNELLTHVNLYPSDMLKFSELPVSPTGQPLEAKVCEDYLSNLVQIRMVDAADSNNSAMVSGVMLTTDTSTTAVADAGKE